MKNQQKEADKNINTGKIYIIMHENKITKQEKFSIYSKWGA